MATVRVTPESVEAWLFEEAPLIVLVLDWMRREPGQVTFRTLAQLVRLETLPGKGGGA